MGYKCLNRKHFNICAKIFVLQFAISSYVHLFCKKKLLHTASHLQWIVIIHFTGQLCQINWTSGLIKLISGVCVPWPVKALDNLNNIKLVTKQHWNSQSVPFWPISRALPQCLTTLNWSRLRGKNKSVHRYWNWRMAGTPYNEMI